MLDGTSHTTGVFRPTITYRVPAGWANYEDLPGNFLLVPPGGDLAGVDAGTSDYIGVYSSIKPSTGCSGGGEDAATPHDIATWIGKQRDLAATAPEPASVGGLRGLVMDIRLSPNPSTTCPRFGGKPVVPIITGAGKSSLDHAVLGGLSMRLYLLARGGGTLAIEVDDVDGGTNVHDLAAVAESLTFASE